MTETTLGRSVRWAVTVGSFGALAVIAVATLWFTDYRVFAKWWLVAVVGFACIVLGWRLTGKRVLRLWRSVAAPKWLLPTGLFVTFLAVKLFFALHLATEQQSDFLMMYQAAQSIEAGDFSLSQTAYWHFFAYQTPFAVYEALMLKVFAGSVVPLLVVNALAMAGTNLLVFLIARRITGSAVAGILAALAYLAYASPYLQGPALTNDHISAALLYLGAYLVLVGALRLPDRFSRPAQSGLADWRRWVLAVAGGLSLGLGNLARPAGLVVCLAVVAALVLVPLQGGKGTRTWRLEGLAALTAVVALAVYALTGAAASAAIKASGINPAGAANNLPEWKFVFGLQAGNQGSQDLIDIDAYGPTPKPDARAIARAAVNRDIRQLPGTWREVLKRQVTSMWVLNESGSYLYWPDLKGEYRYKVPDSRAYTIGHYLVLGERGLFLPIVLMAATGIVLLNRQRRWTYLATFLACFVAAYAVIHLAIEVQPRYRYLVMPAIFALAAPTWAWLSGGVGHHRPKAED